MATSTKTQYRSVDLYGSALSCSLPTTFADVSDIRQVPDNQEVYLDREGFGSVVFDLLERVEKPDQEALEYHLKDIVEEDGDGVGDEDGVRVWGRSEARLSKMPEGTPAYTLFATAPPGPKQRGRAHEPEFVGILLILVRLVEQKTDIVITVNVPHIPGQYDPREVDPQGGKHGALLQRAMECREKVLESFEVRDWGLFV